MSRRPPPYDPSPRTVDLPLTLSEVESIVAGEGADIRRAVAARHFSGRVLATLRHHLETVRQLHARLEAANARVNSPVGLASTLNPLDAVRYLTVDQRADLCQGLLRDQYKAAAADRERAADELAATRRATAKLRLTLLRLAADASLPEWTVAQVRRVLDALDDPALAPPEDGAVHAPIDVSVDVPVNVPVDGGAAPALPPPSPAETLGDLFGDVDEVPS